MSGYIILFIIGALVAFIGYFIASIPTWEFQKGSKRKGLVEEGIHARRLGTCIGLEGVLTGVSALYCGEKDNPVPLYFLIPLSLVACGILLYFIHKHNPTKK